jgi:glucose-1-phosphatase
VSRALLFDIGNVLVHFDFAPAIRRFAERSEAGAGEVSSLLAPLKEAHESGRLGDDEFIAQGMARIGFQGTRAEFAATWGDIFTENSPMTALIDRLAGRHPLYLFSNTSGLHRDWLFEKFPVFARFDGGVYSYEAGVSKPQESIYRVAVKRFGLDPTETLYIDDLPENIATGGRLRFATHLYSANEHDKLEQRVERWLSGG